MIYAKLLMPDYMANSYRDITPEYCMSRGVSTLVCDIDNTLAPYEFAEPDEELRVWYKSLIDSGVRVAFLSNNKRTRVELFSSSLGCPWQAKSGKPGTKGLSKIMKEIGGSKDNTAFLGDQLLTDVACAHTFGIPAWIVPPIKDRTGLFFKFKRRLERPYIRHYGKNGGKIPDNKVW